MIITVSRDGLALPGDAPVRCAIGRGGIKLEKTEGDGVTPVGLWPMRRIFYRADKIPAPRTALPVTAIEQDHGWCDAPEHPDYNRLVTLPFDAGHEKMWRDDDLYDLVVVLGHNDDPVVPYAGSAIFMHVARPDYSPTEGCVALPLEQLQVILKDCSRESCLLIEG